MSLISPSSIAGPSRLPRVSLIRSARFPRPPTARSYAAAQAIPDEENSLSIDGDLVPSLPEDEFGAGDGGLRGSQNERRGYQNAPRSEALSAAERKAKTKLNNFWSSREGFELWKVTDGAVYRRPQPDGRARWLGELHPYPNNPSFHPIAPLSNDLMNVVYRQIRSTKRTPASLAIEFNISKARINAIQKLKEVEDEMRRQNLPLQDAFLKGMETLLGTKKLQSSSGNVDSPYMRNVIGQREQLKDQQVEKEEEARYDEGLGEKGPFGERSAEKLAEKDPLERAIFEFRDEQKVVEARGREAIRQNAVRAARRAATRPDGTIDESKLLDIPVQEAFPTPGTIRTAKEKARAIKEHEARREIAEGKKQGTLYRVNRTKSYRFHDEKIPQEWRTEQRQRRRVKRNEREVAHRELMYGPLRTKPLVSTMSTKSKSSGNSGKSSASTKPSLATKLSSATKSINPDRSAQSTRRGSPTTTSSVSTKSTQPTRLGQNPARGRSTVPLKPARILNARKPTRTTKPTA